MQNTQTNTRDERCNGVNVTALMQTIDAVRNDALAGCLTTSLIYHAAARGIAIDSVESELEGDLDVRGFMGLSEQVRKGYRAIRVRMRVTTDAPVSTLKTLAQFSPVYDVISKSVPVELRIETC